MMMMMVRSSSCAARVFHCPTPSFKRVCSIVQPILFLIRPKTVCDVKILRSRCLREFALAMFVCFFILSFGPKRVVAQPVVRGSFCQMWNAVCCDRYKLCHIHNIREFDRGGPRFLTHLVTHLTLPVKSIETDNLLARHPSQVTASFLTAPNIGRVGKAVAFYLRWLIAKWPFQWVVCSSWSA